MNRLMKLTTLLIIPVLFLMLSGPVLASPAIAVPSLGTAANFVALAYSTMTNTGSGVYFGDVGTFPGTSITGFPPGTFLHGSLHIGDAVAEQALIDAYATYVVLDGLACDHDYTGLDLGGRTLAPGVYCFASSAGLTGDLVLDGLGDPLAVWVFQTGSTLTSASTATVSMINDGQAVNVFWQVGSSATIGTGTRFSGNILALESVTLATAASLTGRAIGLTGAVTMDTEGSPLPITITPFFYLTIHPMISRE